VLLGALTFFQQIDRYPARHWPMVGSIQAPHWRADGSDV